MSFEAVTLAKAGAQAVYRKEDLEELRELVWNYRDGHTQLCDEQREEIYGWLEEEVEQTGGVTGFQVIDMLEGKDGRTYISNQNIEPV